MTIETFLTALARTQGDWFLNGDGAIRSNDGTRVCCPITALGRETLGVHFLRDAYRLGISIDDAVTIAASADNATDLDAFDLNVRERLLAVTVNRAGGK